MAEIAVNAPYKYTFPIEKAFIGEDGKPRLIGAATGPEVDLENQRVAPVLIDKWIGQINGRQIDVVYDDNHRTDQIAGDLGTVEKAWKNESGHMMVQVLLDEDNPMAQYIHKAAMKGKQYGMSVFGKATRFVDEIVSGQRVRTILDGTLERIAHTTRPVWTPSFGTVLSKAVDTALTETANGDTSVSEENKTETPEQKPEVVEKAAAAEANTDSGAAKNPESGKTPSGTEEVVEKAISADSKKDQKKMEKIVKLHGELGALLAEVGLSGEEAATEAAASAEVKKSQSNTEEDERFEKIEKSLSSLADLVVKLAGTPDGSAPGSLRKSEAVDPLAELNAVEDPIERLRLAMAVSHGG
jgi:hypothetical protein